MTSARHSRLLQFSGLILCALVWLANNGNPPTGRTGAPFDGHCNSCHDGTNPGGYDGNVTITGIPATIQANTTYPVTLTMSVTAGSPVVGGFQIVVVDGNNADAGDLLNLSGQTGTENFGTREYLEHRNGKTFANGTASWDFEWRSPASVSGNSVKFYFIGNFTNDNNNDSGDFPIAFLETYAFEGTPPVTATITSSSNVLCNGGNTGSATVEGGGGVAPYTYLWSNGQTTATASNLAANTYTVTVTGSSGSGAATASVVISQPPALLATASVNGVLTCSTTSVNATASASGGTPNYDFNWSNGQTGSSATFTDPGAYTVTATDANGCTKVASVTVTQNITPPTAVAAPGGVLNCTVLQTMLNGNGSSQGASFSYQWTTVNGNIVSGANTLTPTVNQCATYTLLVTNSTNGCTATASTAVTCEVDPPNISVGNTGPLTCVVLNTTLNGNSSTPDVSYSWTGPNNFSSTLQNPTTNVPGTYTLTVSNPVNSCTSTASTVVIQNTVVPTDTTNVSGVITCALDSVQIFMNTNIPNATYLWTGPNGFTSTQKIDTIAVPGDYIGIVTNPGNGCKARDTITVVQNTITPATTAAANGAITCSNTSVQLTGGPAGQFTYAWTGPNNFNSTLQNPTTNTAGNYTLVVKSDANSCTASASVTVQQNTTPPITAIATPANLNCNNTTIQLNATGSSQGADFSYLWTTSNGNIVSGETTLTPVVNTAGTYNLLITNTNNGCATTASATVNQSPAMAASASGTNVSCNGGSNGAATANGSGGIGMYTYLWSTTATTASIAGLSSGTYLVTISDSENCTASATYTVTQPDLLLANASATGETALGAHNGTATAAPTGGSPNYTYAWNNGGSTATITGLAPGSYTVTVGDANGCTAVQTVTVNTFGCTLAADIVASNVTCNGANDGTAGVSLTGAANPVSFIWSNGVTTQNISGLTPGVYTVSVVDGNNCPAVLNTTINEPTAVSANASANAETASGANDGTATATPTGGMGDYTYIWSNGGTTATLSNLAPGTYTVVVSDANNCTATQSVNVSAFNCAISASITSVNASCFGKNDGLATIVLSGGSLPYTYNWSNGATTATANNLAAGSYTVSATDAAGCVATENVSIAQPQQLTAQVTGIQNVVCPGDLNGSATVIPDGGTAPYQIIGSLSNLGVGGYTVTVTDASNCSSTVSFNIISTDTEPPVISCPATIFLCGADFVTYPSPTATDNCLAITSLVLYSGKASGSAFNDGETLQFFRATDGSSNTSTCSFSVIVYPIPDMLIDGTNNDQNGQGVGNISITAIGGGGGFTYAWNRNGQFFSTDEDLTGLNAGSYTLTVTDVNGCTSALAPVIITNTVGANEPSEKGSIRLFPNPTSTSFQLDIIDLEVVAATILDTRGRIVYLLQPNEWENEVLVDHLSTGVYFLRLATENGRVLTLKFVKSE